jgi:division protein CdvB (Snf7/Vps24/ESCRT-III family)
MIIKDRINAILTDLAIKPANEAEALEMTQQLINHFDKIILETMIINLDDDQLARFKGYMANDSEEELDEHITQLAAEVPGLQFKIEAAVQAEMENLKAAKQVLDT